MDISKLLGPPPPGASLQESVFRKLTREVGLRDESWKRRDMTKGELYECTPDDQHYCLLTEFKKEYVRIRTH